MASEATPSAIVKRLKEISTAKPTNACSSRKPKACLHADLPGWNRPRTRALNAAVEIAVDDVVPGAAGAAHGEGADKEQRDVDKARSGAAGGDGGERGRPPAGQQQKPGADRAVQAGEPQVRTRPRRRDRVDPVAGRVGDRTGRPVHRASGLPFSESSVPRPVLVLAAGINRRGADGVAQGRRLRLGGRPFLAGGGAELCSMLVIVLGGLDGFRRGSCTKFCCLPGTSPRCFRPQSSAVTSAQISLRSTLCSTAARTANAFFWASSRS